jgi:hypothetical protein
MKKTMIRKLTYLIFMIAVSATTGCIKETYNMNKLSEKVHLSPTIGISAIKGGVSLIDLIKPNDTVRVGADKFVKIVFKQDSVLELKLNDVYSLNNMVTFTKSFTIGELNIDPFTKTLSFPLSQIVSSIPNPLGAQISNLNNTTSIFPPFPAAPATAITMTETPLPVIANFDNAVFSTGTINISIKNNLPVAISNIKIQLFNSVGHTSIGTQKTITSILPLGTGVATIDLADQTVRSVIAVALSFAGNGSGGKSYYKQIRYNNSRQ